MDTVAIPVEGQTEIFVDKRVGRVAVVVRNDRQRPQRFRLEALQRTFAGLAMQALIGDFGQPLPDLTIDIVQIGELAQRPEVLAKISDSALDFSFFPAAGRIAGMREKSIFTGESEDRGRKRTRRPSCSTTAVARLS
jgi:hypothetical protein